VSGALPWEQFPRAHQMMWKNEHKPGNMAVLVNAPHPGPKTLEDVVEAGK
jgi:crotonyl-CoA carboxylase/reductase